jgi:adenosylcobinamide kinase / adenosylcobinamide-phosphate guanylyltransferase
MALILLLGGARSGKSSLAVDLANRSGLPVTFVATAEARDPEMAERIARHRAARPKQWRTVEEPADLRAAVVEADACLVIDCLSLWVANLLERGWSEEQVEEEAAAVATLAAKRAPPTVAVTNEVGLGIVPATPLGRSYRDVLGRVNAAWASSATQASLVVAGRLLPLSPPADVFAQLDG